MRSLRCDNAPRRRYLCELFLKEGLETEGQASAEVFERVLGILYVTEQNGQIAAIPVGLEAAR